MPVISSLARYNLKMHECYLYPVITRDGGGGGGGLKLAVFFTINRRFRTHLTTQLGT